MRLHLFEWMDQAWLPAFLRDAMRRYLSAAYRTTPLPALWSAQLARVLDETGQTTIVDLGSGAAGAVRLVAAELVSKGRSVGVVCTDLYPMPRVAEPAGRASSSEPHLEYWPAPVDARAVPAALTGVRTVFAAFHHFAATDARQVLRDAFDRRQAICVFEATARTPAAIALSLLIPVLVLALTPTIRPRSAWQLLFTYLVPILPLLIFWDGLVSQLRTYSEAELHELTGGLDAPDYRWTTGRLAAPGIPFAPPFLIGLPDRPPDRT